MAKPRKQKLMKVNAPRKSKREVLAGRILELIEEFMALENYPGDIQMDLVDRTSLTMSTEDLPTRAAVVSRLIDRGLEIS